MSHMGGIIDSFESRLYTGLDKPRKGTLYLASVSGGADSVAMLAGLEALRKNTGFSLHCIHVEHGLRPALESKGDALAVKELCKNLSVPCRIAYIAQGRISKYAASTGLGIEAAARVFRHGIFKRERQRIKADWVLTGHTRDDALETILMRILRGSGPAGLKSMPRLRGHLLRPILEMSRQDILDYLKARGLSYRTDKTNLDTVYLRNKIRLLLIPFLDENFPSWRKSLFSLAETQSHVAEYLTSQAREVLPWEEAGGPANVKGLRLREEDFMKAPPILREEAVFAALNILVRQGNSSPPRRKVIRRAVTEAKAHDLGPARLERQNGYIKLGINKKKSGERGFSLLIKESGLYTLSERVWGREFGGAKGTSLIIQAGPEEKGDFSFSAK